MTSQINGNTQAARNANDGISLAQTAEGDLNQIGTNLQRMRDLAIQSANGTNSVSDRAALNSELQSLAAEIDRVAQNSSFNGVQLLDGTFTAQNFQVGAGATANDHIAINTISSARTSALGSAGTTSTATKVGTAITAALAAGDLTLNGQQIGASSAGIGGGLTSASATQVAVAINAVSATSGVTAAANSNTVTGNAATAFTAIAASTFTINGIDVGAVAAGGTAAGQGANVAAAVNQVSGQTGVTAAADAVTGALTLTAADGRDINIGFTGNSAAKATLVTQTGIATGNIGIPGTSVALGAFTTLASATATDKVALTVDGHSLLASTAVGAGGVLAATVATAMNTFTTANTGYTARLTSTGAVITGAVSGANITAGITLIKTDGTAVDVRTTFSDTTGLLVPAGATSGGFAGASSLGDVVTPVSNTTTAGTGSNSNHGTVTLTSTGANGIVVGGASSTNAGMTTGQTLATVVSSVSSVSAIDISTATGALSSLAVLDGALVTINATRASLGAYQNRFASVVSSLQTTTENLTASRSRIVDTDFAAETASLSRNQILQQAGTAMLAQANQIPNGVLALLR
ncbi:MAG: flagellin [Betaproteobacteria bacterium]|nr:flagellin [Betaproteobacteria bacterium]